MGRKMSSHREVLKTALKQNIHYGHFDLSSGGTSDHYFDVRPVLLHSCTSRAVAYELLRRCDLRSTDIIAGIGVSGSLVVSNLLAHTVKDLRALLVRKEKKIHGLTRIIEGDPLIRNRNVVLVDDVLNRGSNLLFATAALKDLRNCKVIQWVVLVDRSVDLIMEAPEISSVFKSLEILGDSNGQEKEKRQEKQGPKTKEKQKQKKVN